MKRKNKNNNSTHDSLNVIPKKTQSQSLFFNTSENEDFQHVIENLPLSTE